MSVAADSAIRTARSARASVLVIAVLACTGRPDLELRTDSAALLYLQSAPPESAFVAVGVRRSPDGQLSVRSDSAGEFDRRLTVTRQGAAAPIPVITIREADPGSGISYGYAWTRDGRALLIRGTGSIDGGQVRAL